MAKKNAKKTKNVLSTILVVLFVALLGNHIYYQVTKNAEPAAESYVLKFEGGPIDELDISDIYVEGMTWYELWKAIDSQEEKGDYYITATYAITLVEFNDGYVSGANTSNYFLLQIDGENITDYSSVIDLSVTYTLTPME